MAAKVVSCVNGKGGSGKSTVAWNLGNFWAAGGKRVLFIETDPQATLITWYTRREDKTNMAGESIPPAALTVRHKRGFDGYDIVVIDTPGRLAEIAPAIKMADAIVCPVQPTGADYTAFQRTVAAVTSERMADRIYALPNRVKTDAQATEIRATLPAIMAGKGRVSAHSLGDWVAYQQETLVGLCVLDIVREADKQRQALAKIAKEIEEVMGA